MNWKEFLHKTKSNETFDDDFFMPSDSVWDSINDELGNPKKDRKPIIFLSSILLMMSASFGYVMLNKSTTMQVVSTPNTSIHQKHENALTQTSEILSLDDDKGKTVLASSNELIPIERDAVRNNKRSDQKTMVESINRNDSVKASYAASSLGRHSRLERSKNDNATHSKVTQPRSTQHNSSSPFNVNAATARLGLNTNENSTRLNSTQMRKVSRSELNIMNLPNGHFTSPEWNRNFFTPPGITLVKTDKPKWKIEWASLASMTSYNIAMASQPSAVDFQLDGYVSHQHNLSLHWKYNRDWSFYVGIGMDYSHFEASYIIPVSDQGIDIVENSNGTITGNIRATIPSLAGGLDSEYALVTQNRSALEDRKIYLALAHNYKTMTVPIGLSKNMISTGPWNLGFRMGLEYSRRKISIDTGIESLHTGEPEDTIELTAIAPTPLSYQPFRIHNMTIMGGAYVDYHLTPHFSAGLQLLSQRPLWSIYDDNNIRVKAWKHIAGISLKYSL